MAKNLPEHRREKANLGRPTIRRDPETGITPQMEKFCAAYVLNDRNAALAYRLAYKPKNQDPQRHAELGCKLLKHSHIAARIAELLERTSISSECTLETHMSKLAEIRDLALRCLDFKAAASCEVHRGMVVGFYRAPKGEAPNPNQLALPGGDPTVVFQDNRKIINVALTLEEAQEVIKRHAPRLAPIPERKQLVAQLGRENVPRRANPVRGGAQGGGSKTRR